METNYKPGQLLTLKDCHKEHLRNKHKVSRVPDYIKVLGSDLSPSKTLRVQCSYISRLDYISDFHETWDAPISELRNLTEPLSCFKCDKVGRRGIKVREFSVSSKPHARI
jgi:hypothetical protein